MLHMIKQLWHKAQFWGLPFHEIFGIAFYSSGSYRPEYIDKETKNPYLGFWCIYVGSNRAFLT